MTNTAAGRSVYRKEKCQRDKASETNDSEQTGSETMQKAKTFFARRLWLTHAVCVIANCEKKGEEEKKRTRKKQKKK